MGLIKQNYEYAGITIPNAYAIIKDLEIHGAWGVATFIVSTSRENALKNKAIETKKIRFDIKRNESPYTTAYKEATSIKTVIEKDVENGEIVNLEKQIFGAFYGWENNIV